MPTTSGHSLLGNGIELEGGAQTSRIISAVDSQLHGLIHQQSCRGIFFFTCNNCTSHHTALTATNKEWNDCGFTEWAWTAGC